MNSFIVVGVYYWTTVEWKELLPDSSLSHLDYESRSYDIGLCGTSMSGICYIIAVQYWEAWGLFWKRRVSLCFLGVLFGFGFWVVCVVVCCLVLCVFWWHLDYCLTFSLLRGNRQSKQDVLMTVWASSAHGTGKKKKHPEASSTITSAPLAPAPQGNTPPPSPRTPDTGRSRSPPPGRLRPIGMHPGQPLSIIFCSGSVLLYHSSSYNICWLRAG